MKIVYEHNGTVHIASIPAQERVALSNIEVQNMEYHEFLAWIINLTVPKTALNVAVVDDHIIPTDRTFRNALKADLTYDKLKCVEITKNRLRLERAPLMQALDIEQLNAEDKPTLARIKADKQRLRDVTLQATSDLSLDQLKALHA